MAQKPGKPPLSIVASPVTTVPDPPRKLGEAGLSLWRAQCCAAADRAEALAARIDEDGEKAHPCLKDELAARSFVIRTLQRLGVTDEPVKAVGRPPRAYGWKKMPTERIPLHRSKGGSCQSSIGI